MADGICLHLLLVRAILEHLVECCDGGERGTKWLMFAARKNVIASSDVFLFLLDFNAFEHTKLIMSLHSPLPTQMTFQTRGPNLTTSRGFKAETKRTLKWMKCQQICLLSWVMDLAPALFQWGSAFKQLLNSSCTTAPCFFHSSDSPRFDKL